VISLACAVADPGSDGELWPAQAVTPVNATIAARALSCRKNMGANLSGAVLLGPNRTWVIGASGCDAPQDYVRIAF
jgi:hypothetical protein